MEELIENYMVKNLEEFFPDATLVEREMFLPNGKTVDLHLKCKKGEHVFVEIKRARIGKSQIGQLIDFYSAVSNLGPSYSDSKLVVIGESMDQEAKEVLSRIGVEFIPFTKLGISRERILRDQREQRLRLLTPLEAEIVSNWEANGTKIVTVDDIVEDMRLSRNYARKIVHKLSNKKWLERIKKGFYLFIPAEYGYTERFPPMDRMVVGTILVQPYYYSYATSNTHHGFTSQVRPTLYIATLKTKRDFAWRNGRFKFVTLTEDKFFGYEEFHVQDYEVCVASPEKSIVDSVDKVKYAGGVQEVTNVIYNGLNRKISCKKLIDYAIKMKSYSLVQRMGFLIDLLAKENLAKFPQSEKEALTKHIGATTIYLASTKKYGKKGQMDRTWNIIQNVPTERLLGEIVIR